MYKLNLFEEFIESSGKILKNSLILGSIVSSVAFNIILLDDYLFKDNELNSSSALFYSFEKNLIKTYLKDDINFLNKFDKNNNFDVSLNIYNNSTPKEYIDSVLYKIKYGDNNNIFTGEYTFYNKDSRKIIIGVKLNNYLYSGMKNKMEKNIFNSFVFFHEYAHYLQSSKYESIYYSNRIEEVNDLQKLVYKESFADIFSILLLIKKYPELNKEKLINEILDFRSGKFYSEDHDTTFALYNLDTSKDYNTMTDILKEADKLSKMYLNSCINSKLNNKKHFKHI